MLWRLLHWLALLGPIAFFMAGRYGMMAVAGLVYLITVWMDSAWRRYTLANARSSTYDQAMGKPREGPLEFPQAERDTWPKELLALFEGNREQLEAERARECFPAFQALRALLRKQPDLGQNSPEVQDLLDSMPIIVAPDDYDSRRLPPRLVPIDFVSTITALALAVWGTIVWLG